MGEHILGDQGNRANERKMHKERTEKGVVVLPRGFTL